MTDDGRGGSSLAGLSPAQRGAVLHGEGPLLIIAGTGKTTVLTRRIAHLGAWRDDDPAEFSG